jgi:hypothetical protein
LFTGNFFQGDILFHYLGGFFIPKPLTYITEDMRVKGLIREIIIEK